jgi:hypothetical protein
VGVTRGTISLGQEGEFKGAEYSEFRNPSVSGSPLEAEDAEKGGTGDRASNPSGRGVGWRREREQDHRIAVSHDDFSRDVLASLPEICPGQISWDYDRAEIIADGVVHAIGVCLGLIGVTIVVIAVNIERIEIAPILVYVIGLVTMLALSAAYNVCLARQVGSAPLRPLRDAGLGSRALAYLQLVSRTCR